MDDNCILTSKSTFKQVPDVVVHEEGGYTCMLVQGEAGWAEGSYYQEGAGVDNHKVEAVREKQKVKSVTKESTDAEFWSV